MKQLALALAAVLVASSPLLAEDAVRQPATPAVKQRVVKPAKRPVLDQFGTQSIAPAPGRATADRPAPRKERSGIEINPWVVPNFL